MNGFVSPASSDVKAQRLHRPRPLAWLRRHLSFLLVVVAPTMVVAGYLYGVASDQYLSEARFLVRSASSRTGTPSGLAQLLTGGGTASGTQGEAAGLADYMASHDAVAALQQQLGLAGRFQRTEIDPLSRLRSAAPSPEALLKYYRRYVSVRYDADTGITALHVRAFSPQDAYLIARRLMQLGERRLNEMNARSYEDAVALARSQVTEATAALTESQKRLTSYRQSGRDVDPATSAAAQIKLVSELDGQLAVARAQLSSVAATIGTSAPQYEALRRRVAGLEAQTSGLSGRLAGDRGALAAGLGDYEQLKLQQDLLFKRVELASAGFQSARDEAVRQQLYLVRLVDANLPVKALYPRRAIICLTVFFALLITYGIGWLIAAGFREHAAS